MSEIDRSRVVDMSDEQLDEFTCAICHSILFEPVVTKCCRQIYCKQCIHEWLEQSNTCPNDRQPLMASGLSDAPRIVINLINTMKVKCEFHTLGCNVVIGLDQIKNHVQQCHKNPNKMCGICGIGSESDFDHNCIANLQLNQCTFDEKIQTLGNEIKSLNNQLNQYSSGKLPVSHMLSVIERARQHFQQIHILNPSFSEIEKTKCIEVAKQAITSCNKYDDIARYFYRDSTKINPSKLYFAVVFAENGGQSLVPGYHYLELRFGPLYIEVFSVEDEALETEVRRLKTQLSQFNNKNISETHMQTIIFEARRHSERVQVNSSNLGKVLENKCIAVAKLAIANCKTHLDIAKYICHNKHLIDGKTWQVVVFVENGGQSQVIAQKYLQIKFGPLIVEIFK